MRWLDDDLPEGRQELKALYPHTGKAWILGITGSPGAGKSTLTDQLIRAFRREGLTVGVVAIDPTSPFSGGAILGDRIRMQDHER
ncbi:MAG: ATP/GTP-binding protein, partial [Pararhodobacter sp.]|nr:ATP/GTP-binding protein [Pararhodobacter sp.]